MSSLYFIYMYIYIYVFSLCYNLLRDFAHFFVEVLLLLTETHLDKNISQPDVLRCSKMAILNSLEILFSDYSDLILDLMKLEISFLYS
jgi:hypothetical protein